MVLIHEKKHRYLNLNILANKEICEIMKVCTLGCQIDEYTRLFGTKET